MPKSKRGSGYQCWMVCVSLSCGIAGHSQVRMMHPFSRHPDAPPYSVTGPLGMYVNVHIRVYIYIYMYTYIISYGSYLLHG